LSFSFILTERIESVIKAGLATWTGGNCHSFCNNQNREELYDFSFHIYLQGWWQSFFPCGISATW